MKMKLSRLFPALLGALVLSACSKDDPGNGGSTPDLGEGEPRYMSVTIRNSNTGGTRVGGDQTSDGSDLYEEGYAAENKVKSLRFYFFKEDGSPAPVKFNGDNYYDCKEEEIQPGTPGTDMPNVESILNAVIVINTNTNEGSRNDIKQMVAVVNYAGVESKLTGKTNPDKPKNMSLAELEAVICSNDAVGNTTDGFLMTSSSYYANDKNTFAVAIQPEDIKSTEDQAKANPVDVYVERLVAKVRVSEAWQDMTVIPGVQIDTADDKYKGATYTAIALKDNKNRPILDGNQTGDQLYVIFTDWQLWWTAAESYLFKKTGNWDSALAGWDWNKPEYNRSYWAENTATVKLEKFNHNYPSLKLGKGNGTDYKLHSAYCLENAADADNGGLKKWYDPDATTSNRTLVYLKALIVKVNDATKKATPVNLVEWAGYKYSKESALIAMFAPNVNEFYFLHKSDNNNPPTTDSNGNVVESGSTTYTYIPLKATDVEFVSGLTAGMASAGVENSNRYLSFLNVIPESKGLWGAKTDNDGNKLEVVHQIYKKVGTGKDGKALMKEVTIEEVNTQLCSVGGAKVWDGGNAYYYHEIKHLGKTGIDNESNPFTYGVVRNHIYEVELNSVIGLGTPVLVYKDENGEEVWEDIIPQKPTPDAYFLGARLNILSWRVVSNGVNLDW